MPARRRARRARRAGSARAAEEPEAFIAVHATGAGRVTSSSRLCVRCRRTRCSAATAARARIVSRSPGSSKLARRGRRRALPRAGRRARPASPPCRRPGPATPVTADRDVGAEPLPRALRHRRGGLRRDGAVALEHLRRHAEPLLLDLVRVRDDPAREDVARARAPRSAAPRRGRPCTTRRWRASARAPGRARARAPRSALRRPRRATRRAARRSRAASSAAPLLRARLDDEVDVDLEVAGADRRLHPVAVAARARRAPARPPTRSRRRSAARGAPGGSARARAGAHRLALERLAARAAAARAAAPGSTTPTQPVELAARAPAPSPRARATTAPSGTRRLLRTPGREVRVRPAEPLGDRRGDGLDLALERLVDHERPAGGPREQLDRAVVVRRAEAARDEAAASCLEALRERRLELRSGVADDRDPRGSMPERSSASAAGTGRSGRCARRARARCP